MFRTVMKYAGVLCLGLGIVASTKTAIYGTPAGSPPPLELLLLGLAGFVSTIILAAAGSTVHKEEPMHTQPRIDGPTDGALTDWRRVLISIWGKAKPVAFASLYVMGVGLDEIAKGGLWWSWIILNTLASVIGTALMMATVPAFINRQLAPIGMVAIFLVSMFLSPIYWIREYRRQQQEEILLEIRALLQQQEAPHAKE